MADVSHSLLVARGNLDSFCMTREQNSQKSTLKYTSKKINIIEKKNVQNIFSGLFAVPMSLKVNSKMSQ